MIEPAWYDDEDDPSISRWHDGTDWTHHTVVKADWAEEPPPPRDAWPVPTATPEPVVLRLEDVQPPPEPPAVDPVQATAPERAGDQASEPDPRWAPGPTTQPKQRGRILLPVVGLLLVVTVALRLFVVDGDEEDDPFTSSLPSHTAEWTTVDGSTYRITVVPSSEPQDEASSGGCIGAPEAGRANYAVAVRIENLSPGPAPVPNVILGANATEAGALDTSPDSLAGAYHRIELAPRARGAACEEAHELRPDGRATLEPAGVVQFDATVGGIVDPVPAGLALVVRYVQADPADPEVPTTADFLAPFPPAGRAP